MGIFSFLFGKKKTPQKPAPISYISNGPILERKVGNIKKTHQQPLLMMTGQL